MLGIKMNWRAISSDFLGALIATVGYFLIYGISKSTVTASMCPEYFNDPFADTAKAQKTETFFLRISDNPYVLALLWIVVTDFALGIVFGLFFGLLIVITGLFCKRKFTIKQYHNLLQVIFWCALFIVIMSGVTSFKKYQFKTTLISEDPICNENYKIEKYKDFSYRRRSSVISVVHILGYLAHGFLFISSFICILVFCII